MLVTECPAYFESLCRQMLLVSEGTTSTSILLNGLSVSFVLHLDAAIPHVFLTAAEQHKMCAYFSEVAAKAGSARLAGLPTGLQEHRIFETPIRMLTSIVAFAVPFFRLVSEDSGTTCETLLYYVYYRAGVMLALWLPFGAREVLEQVASAVALARVHREDPEAAKERANPEVRRALYQLSIRFSETLCCALCMNALFWLFCHELVERPSVSVYASSSAAGVDFTHLPRRHL